MPCSRIVGAVRMYVSDAVLAEYTELLHRKSFPLDRRRATLLLRTIRKASMLVTSAGPVFQTYDPDDNIFLECAESARAQYLITGNTAHFPRRWKYTEVVTPRLFMNAWKGFVE